MSRLLNVGVALSQLLHMIVTLGGGNPKMTTSARLGKQVERGAPWARAICWFISLLLFDPNHCAKAYNADRKRARCAHAD